jgi:RecQ family ATP-dependent DNA helicase
LNERFQLEKFKKGQWKVIRSIIYDKRDSAIVASTGFGKSLTFQFPPVFLNKIAIVISPLISLAHDQHLSLVERGIASTYFNSTQSDRKIPLRFHEYSVIYLTPDALLNDPLQFYGSRIVQKNVHRIIDRVCMFAIDEAHVVSQWCDFRPVMNDLYKIREKYCKGRNIPILTLTATCPMYVEIKINNILRMVDPFKLRTTLNRPNLFFEVRRKSLDYGGEEKAMEDLLPILKEQKDGSIIIYVIRVDDSNSIAERLNERGIKCKPYNSKLKKEEKETTLRSFRAGELKTVVCTIAFGMGIDRPDVRAVLHYGMPRTLEGYYQEGDIFICFSFILILIIK